MPYKDVTYDNGFTERFYYDETPSEEALRMSWSNSVKEFPSANAVSAARKSTKEIANCEDAVSLSKIVVCKKGGGLFRDSRNR